MAQQTINVGTVAGDGTGDPGRTCLTKANDNFTELYAKFPIADGDLSSNVVLKTAAQTLTNKTLTSPVVNTPTGIVKGDVGLGNVDNTSDATKNAASVTLTNKTLTSPVINTPTGIVKGDVGLGNADNTSDATKNAASVTLTNKTLTSPVINTPTGIVKGDVGLGNVDNTSDATKDAASTTLTNKTLTTPTIASFANANHTHTNAAGGGVLGSIVTVSSAQTAIGTAFADVTSLSFAVLANASYEFKFLILADADATTTGIDVACNGPASPTFLSYEQRYWTTLTAESVVQATTYDSDTASTGSNGATARSFIVTGVLVNGANAGTLSARIKRENVGTGPNVRAGSFGTIVRRA